MSPATSHSHFSTLLPPFLLAISAAVFGFTLHTTTQSRRLIYILPFLVSSALTLATVNTFSSSPAITALWSQAVTLYILHAISLLYIEQWPAPRQPSSGGRLKVWIWRIATTYRLWGNPRLVQVQRTSNEREDVQHLLKFIRPRVIKLGVYYLLHIHVIPFVLSKTLIEITPMDLAPTQQGFQRNLAAISVRGIAIRTYLSLSWIWESVLYLDGANCILAILFTSVQIDRPLDWPPLFGKLSQASSLRSFWSRFWHQLAVRPYGNFGRLLASVLVPKSIQRSYLRNAMTAFVVFSLSGITHAIVSFNCGHKDWDADLRWFLLNFAGCTMETFIIATIRRLAKYAGVSRQLARIERSWVGSVLGYLWVFVFFWWSVPGWRYGRLRRQAKAMKMQKYMVRLAEVTQEREKLTLRGA